MTVVLIKKPKTINVHKVCISLKCYENENLYDNVISIVVRP